MARFTAGLLKTAMINLYAHEKDILQDYIKIMDEGDVVNNIINMPGESLVQHHER